MIIIFLAFNNSKIICFSKFFLQTMCVCNQIKSCKLNLIITSLVSIFIYLQSWKPTKSRILNKRWSGWFVLQKRLTLKLEECWEGKLFNGILYTGSGKFHYSSCAPRIFYYVTYPYILSAQFIEEGLVNEY